MAEALIFEDMPLEEARKLVRGSMPAVIEQTYGWRRGYQPKIDADIAGRRIAILASDLQRPVEADDVVEDATPEDAPLHQAFEWDDRLAAHEHRLEVARSMLRCIVRLTTVPGQDVPQPQRMLVHVTLPVPEGSDAKPVSGYLAAEAVNENAQLREQRAAKAIQELRSWLERYREVIEIRPQWEAVRRILQDGPASRPHRASRSA